MRRPYFRVGVFSAYVDDAWFGSPGKFQPFVGGCGVGRAQPTRAKAVNTLRPVVESRLVQEVAETQERLIHLKRLLTRLQTEGLEAFETEDPHKEK